MLEMKELGADYAVGLNDQSQEQNPGWEAAKLEARVSAIPEVFFGD